MKINLTINVLLTVIALIPSLTWNCSADQNNSINGTIDYLIDVDEFKAEETGKLRQLGDEGMRVMVQRLKNATPEVRKTRLSAMIIFILKDNQVPQYHRFYIFIFYSDEN